MVKKKFLATEFSGISGMIGYKNLNLTSASIHEYYMDISKAMPVLKHRVFKDEGWLGLTI